jgi:hypothetical protein
MDWNVENRLDKMEKRINQLDQSFIIFKDIILKMQKENIAFKKDKDYLVEKYKDLVKQLQPEKNRLAKDVHKKLVSSVKNKVEENADFFKEFAKEGLQKENKEKEREEKIEKDVETPIDDLFVIVMKNGKIKLNKVAKMLNAHELQVEEWAKILEDHGLIEIYKEEGQQPELRKPGYGNN